MRRSATFNNALVTVALGALAPGAHAHHSAAMYKENVTVEGTIVEVAWQNPHVYLTIESQGPDGTPRQQDVAGASLSTIGGLGLTREMVAPGTRVKIDAKARQSATDHLLWGERVTFDDGSTYLLETGGANAHIPPVPAATGLAGKWVPPPESMEVFGQPFPLTEAATAARQAVLDDPSWRSVSFCDRVPAGAAAVKLIALPVLHTLEVDDKNVVLRIDDDGRLFERVIHLDQKTHPADVAPSARGHSIGHWEGRTLVIDTVAFTPSPVSSRELHVVERLTLAEDKRRLNYEATMEDPELWTETFTLSNVWDYRPDVEPSGAACDRQNAVRHDDEPQ